MADPYVNSITGSASDVDGASEAEIYVFFNGGYFNFHLDEDSYATIGLPYRASFVRTVKAALAEYDALDQTEINLEFKVGRPSDNGNSFGVKILNDGSTIVSSLSVNGVDAGVLDIEHLRNFLTLIEGAPAAP